MPNAMIGTRPKDETKQPEPVPNVRLRILTALVVIPLVLLTTFSGGWFFNGAVMLLFGVAALEFYAMARHKSGEDYVILGVLVVLGIVLSFALRVPLIGLGSSVMGLFIVGAWGWFKTQSPRIVFDRMMHFYFGILYVGYPAGFIVAIRAIEPAGLVLLYGIIAATWGTDTFAYLVGRVLGKTPFFPQISPNKTREGALGGVVGGVFLSTLVYLPLLTSNMQHLWLLLLLAPCFAVVGDLFESAIKRYFGVKDSGVPGCNPLPGHGGVLDRIDALLWVIAFYFVYLWATGVL